jgi:hypothetical protein
MELEENTGLREYGIYKKLMECGVVDKRRNVMVEYKNGHSGILHIHAKENDPFPKLKEIERITFFIDGEEYEFVACQ